MTTATLTSKGQITIPKAIRELLGLGRGDRLEFRLNDRGKVEIDPVRENALDRIQGMLHDLVGDGPALTIEEMHAAIAQHVIEDDERIRSGR